jgi:predicted glycoside hydrolase/deacetylase ChbG (UPF0249 family)
MRQLIINSDDFGYTPAVSRGIVEAHRAGVLTSTSLLPNLEGFEDAVRLAREEVPELGIGMHINLVQGVPLARVPTLTDPLTGEFHSMPRLTRLALTGRIAAADVVAECTAQIRRLRWAGVHITHVDSHKHAHVLPGIWRPLAQTALREGIRAMRWPVPSARVTPWQAGAQGKEALAGLVWRAARRNAPPLRHPDHLIELPGHGARLTLPGLLRLLDRLPPGISELVVHVGYVDDALARADQYTWQRERELEVLTSPAVRERLHCGDIALVTFGALH